MFYWNEKASISSFALQQQLRETSVKENVICFHAAIQLITSRAIYCFVDVFAVWGSCLLLKDRVSCFMVLFRLYSGGRLGCRVAAIKTFLARLIAWCLLNHIREKKKNKPE